MTLGQDFLPALLFPPVSIIPPILHTHLHLHVPTTRRTNGRILQTNRRAMLFRKPARIERFLFCITSLYTNVSQPFRRHGTLDLALHISRYPLRKTSIVFKLIYFLIISYLRDITVYCCWVSVYSLINHLTPNGHYMGRTAQLTSRCCILYIYSTNIRTEYFKHAA